MSTKDTSATQDWKKEVQYLCEEQIGHVIGVDGINVKHWLTQGCTTIIDKPRKCIVIFGQHKDEVLQTTIEVQEKLMLYLQLSHNSLKQENQEYRLKQEQRVLTEETSQYLNFDTIIEGKDLEIDGLKQEIRDYRLKLEKQKTEIRWPMDWSENEPYCDPGC